MNSQNIMMTVINNRQDKNNRNYKFSEKKTLSYKTILRIKELAYKQSSKEKYIH